MGLRHRLRTIPDFHSQHLLNTLDVCDSVVKNCGPDAAYHISRQKFVTVLYTLLRLRRPSATVQTKLLRLIMYWMVTYSATEAPGIHRLVERLNSEGVQFPPPDNGQPPARLPAPQPSAPALPALMPAPPQKVESLETCAEVLASDYETLIAAIVTQRRTGISPSECATQCSQQMEKLSASTDTVHTAIRTSPPLSGETLNAAIALVTSSRECLICLREGRWPPGLTVAPPASGGMTDPQLIGFEDMVVKEPSPPRDVLQGNESLVAFEALGELAPAQVDESHALPAPVPEQRPNHLLPEGRPFSVSEITTGEPVGSSAPLDSSNEVTELPPEMPAAVTSLPPTAAAAAFDSSFSETAFESGFETSDSEGPAPSHPQPVHVISTSAPIHPPKGYVPPQTDAVSEVEPVETKPDDPFAELMAILDNK
ncbi:hypothetical protein KIPB_002332 [Kipferlia bialata]|uniref:VHS domain-containing protein n=1 Tax=Kipferlia bialata TaxID=797122 RepID=A0A9K3CS35_9EUKA|nr:hypothetical protein KIPB_002332 [Kipferlia bialata]|eukprot:g2332.t1